MQPTATVKPRVTLICVASYKQEPCYNTGMPTQRSGFDSQSGQIACFHGVKNRLSTIGTGDVLRRLDSI